MMAQTPGNSDNTDESSDDLRVRMIELIMSLRTAGIRDTKVLAAIERVPRHLFVNSAFSQRAYSDIALPIECGQTISQPYIVAYMSELLKVSDRHKVLEVGTGSGYQTAVLSHLARRVYTIERYRTLGQDAEARFVELHLSNITAMIGDGTEGWPTKMDFDRIIVTAAAAEIPKPLLDQLRPDGIMVIPVGVAGGTQHVVRATRVGDELKFEKFHEVRFVPLVPGKAQQL